MLSSSVCVSVFAHVVSPQCELLCRCVCFSDADWGGFDKGLVCVVIYPALGCFQRRFKGKVKHAFKRHIQMVKKK